MLSDFRQRSARPFRENPDTTAAGASRTVDRTDSRSSCPGNGGRRSGRLGGGGRLERRVAEHEPVRSRVDLDAPAVAELPEEHLVGQYALDLRLDQARHRPRAEGLVVAALGEPAPRAGRELDGHAAGEELRIELGDELVHHALDRLGAERAELDHRVEAVPELGGEETLE